jgi:aminobenzoyl-glutamate utilization protein B
MALTITDLFESPQTLKDAKIEFEKARGAKEFKYQSMVGDRKPALDYRK